MDYYLKISNCSRLIELLKEKIKNINPFIAIYDYQLEFEDESNMFDFLKELNQIKEKIAIFWTSAKRRKDFEIFVEFIAIFASKPEETIFITDDEYFVKSAKKSLNTLRKYVDVSNLRVCLLDDFLEHYKSWSGNISFRNTKNDYYNNYLQ